MSLVLPVDRSLGEGPAYHWQQQGDKVHSAGREERSLINGARSHRGFFHLQEVRSSPSSCTMTRAKRPWMFSPSATTLSSSSTT